jgi:hypothetical protein
MQDPPTLQKLEDVFGNLVSTLVAIGAFGLLIMLLWGGFKYLSSGGDQKATESARNTITYAIGGFIFLAGSYMVLKIIEGITGVSNITNFTIFKN